MNSRKKVANPGTILGLIFFLVGLGMLIGGIAVCVSGAKYKTTAEKIVGVISDIESYRDSDGDTEYDVWVVYNYMAEEYETRIGYYSSFMDIGDSIDLYVQPDNPARAKSAKGLNFSGVVLIFMGVIFALVGGNVMFGGLIRKARGNKIKKTGRKIYAEVLGGSICRNYEVNGRNPFKLECKYEDIFSGETYLYSSDYMWEDPGVYTGSQVAVYIDPNDMSNYYVDLDSLQTPIAPIGGGGNVIHDYR